MAAFDQLTKILYGAARTSANARAINKGPDAVFRRAARKLAIRAVLRSLR
jgi:hypothetical protein